MKKKSLLLVLASILLITAFAVAANAAGLIGTDDAPEAVEVATTTAADTEAADTAAVTDATTEATTEATAEAATEPLYTSWTDRSGVTYYIDAEGREPGVVYVSSEVDCFGRTHWFDENGKEPHKFEYSPEEKAQQFLDTQIAQPSTYDSRMIRKENLIKYIDELLNGRSADELSEIEKETYDKYVEELDYIHEHFDGKRELYENGDNRVWCNLYTRLWEEQGMLEYYKEDLKMGVLPEETKWCIERCEKKLAIYEKCIEMYERGADELTVLTYMYDQIWNIN